MGWLTSVVGALLVVAVLRDIFHTLWHPMGHGAGSRGLMRAVWWLARRSGDRGMRLAGPLATLAVVGAWNGVVLLGWMLVYLPHLPGSFSYGTGLDPAARSSVVDALYLSLVTVSTLGFGDIVPVAAWLRVATPLAGLIGFALLTAAVTWILQLYPALGRRRALAVQLRQLREAGGGLSADEVIKLLPVSTLHAVAAEVATVDVDFAQYPEMYYFHDGATTSLAAVAPWLLGLAEAAARSPREQVRLAGTVVSVALADLATTLDQQYLRMGGDAAAVFPAYGSEHRQPAPPS